jgi:hypothetical protein
MIVIRLKTAMPFAWITAIALAAALSAAQQPVQPQSGAEPVQSPPKACIAVQEMSGHLLRHVLLSVSPAALLALRDKEQYKVLYAIGSPARVGQKYHGKDLRAIQSDGTKVVLVDKSETQEDFRKACQ